ncbi:tyrosine-type recombinase/integrase [Nonomuraea sp. NPDC050536]|uniref:tyrosine-type recombinase/integrase n=1 Tax=Nonomuraea sp. NPDC050536 TaxID=3364366 RepID=UPI0037C9ACC6
MAQGRSAAQDDDRERPGDGVLTPTALLRPGALARGVATGPSGSAPAPGAPPLPAPLLVSVGDIPGLRPRRRRGDGGEVPGADVDLVDALPRDSTTGSWPTVAAWLRAGKTAATRRARLTDLAAFLRWLQHARPGRGLWQVTEDDLVAYADEVGTGSGAAALLHRGPLGAATVARHLSSLSSLYTYAVRRHPAVAINPATHVTRPEVPKIGTTPALPLTEAAALLRGAQAIAARYPADAAAVALLVNLGLRAAELEGLTVGRLGRDAGHPVIRFRLKGGRHLRLPLAEPVVALVQPLTRGRAAADLLLTRDDGRPFDRWRQQTALRRAARAAGLRADRITPHMLRATAATLLLDADVPVDAVQELLGHTSPVTTQRYDRGQAQLDGHAAYRLTALLTQSATADSPAPADARDTATLDLARAPGRAGPGPHPGTPQPA